MGSNRVKLIAFVQDSRGGLRALALIQTSFRQGAKRDLCSPKRAPVAVWAIGARFLFAFSSFLLIFTATALMDLFPARLVFYKFQLELLLNAMTSIYSFAVANL